MNPTDLFRVVAELSDDDRAVLAFLNQQRKTEPAGLVFASLIRAHFMARGWTAERLSKSLAKLAGVGLIERHEPTGAA